MYIVTIHPVENDYLCTFALISQLVHKFLRIADQTRLELAGNMQNVRLTLKWSINDQYLKENRKQVKLKLLSPSSHKKEDSFLCTL